MNSSECTLLDTNGCRLTDRRLVTPDGATYVLQQITSTRLEQRTRGGELAGGVILGAILALGTASEVLSMSLVVGAGPLRGNSGEPS